MYDLVTRTAEQCFMPLTVGGGVRSGFVGRAFAASLRWSVRNRMLVLLIALILVVEADDNGDICLYTSGDAALVVDINGLLLPKPRTDR